MFQFEPVSLPPEAEALRQEVREFIEAELPEDYLRNSDFNTGESPELSQKLGAKGWIGMTWPRQYGGGERSFLERYVVTEELLAAGAPVFAHWIADRQSGAQFLKFGTEAQRQEYLPRIARGECYFSIGMSEPDSGSDLASIRSSAVKVDGGWKLNGSKIWTSGAHHNHYMIALIRTEPPSENRHAGMSQVIVDLKDPAVTVTGIKNLAGNTDFNQVFFDDVFISDDHVIGEPGNGWVQVMSELGYERSGPERFLSAFRVMVEFVRAIGPEPTDEQAAVIGRMMSEMITLRRMSISVAGMLQDGKMPNTEAALIKDVGNTFERMVPELIRQVSPDLMTHRLAAQLQQTILHAPSFTLRGGTREILRGMIARGLGLR